MARIVQWEVRVQSFQVSKHIGCLLFQWVWSFSSLEVLATELCKDTISQINIMLRLLHEVSCFRKMWYVEIGIRLGVVTTALCSSAFGLEGVA